MIPKNYVGDHFQKWLYILYLLLTRLTSLFSIKKKTKTKTKQNKKQCLLYVTSNMIWLILVPRNSQTFLLLSAIDNFCIIVFLLLFYHKISFCKIVIFGRVYLPFHCLLGKSYQLLLNIAILFHENSLFSSIRINFFSWWGEGQLD